MDELVIGEKKYISSKRAAEISGYAKDYIGQLCREGRVEATLVGRSWYVLEQSVREHRFGREESSSSSTTAPEKALEAWKTPIYSHEEVVEIPPLVTEEDVREVDEEIATKQAWDDWFKQKHQVVSSNLHENTTQISHEDNEEIQGNDFYVREVEPAPILIHKISEDAHSFEKYPQASSLLGYQNSPYSDPTLERLSYIKNTQSHRIGQNKVTYVIYKTIFVSLAFLAILISLLGNGMLQSAVTQLSVLREFTNFIAGVESINK